MNHIKCGKKASIFILAFIKYRLLKQTVSEGFECECEKKSLRLRKFLRRKMRIMNADFDSLLNSMGRYLITTWQLHVIYRFNYSTKNNKKTSRKKIGQKVVLVLNVSLLTNPLIAFNLTSSFPLFFVLSGRMSSFQMLCTEHFRLI